MKYKCKNLDFLVKECFVPLKNMQNVDAGRVKLYPLGLVMFMLSFHNL